MRNLIWVAALAVSASAMANSNTMVTFADPAANASSPLFTFNTNTNILSGSWTGNGLTVRTPGINGGVVENAKFVTTNISLVQVPGSGIYTGGSGRVTFYTDSVENPFFVVDFTGATLFNPLNFGASEFNGSTVNFSGPGVPAGLTSEQFSFALANPTMAGNTINYTASFTSSAVPEPASMTALALGAAAMLRRRKAAKKS